MSTKKRPAQSLELTTTSNCCNSGRPARCFQAWCL